ncbi:Chitin-binding type 1 [Arabidopsis thaliana x Arabidopsis arenosa]|uniref:chitinase n=1 Tax=Arabidopsis thaliana x Arabidopsis arenosa TaxID=1240361 RepID=A0A8T2AS39_9BRAS|nr:Chitin-binding type 1 [Arabidopsis thaliana x Arabidopsis arenosa]
MYPLLAYKNKNHKSVSKMKTYLFPFLIFSLLLSFSSAEQCGSQAEGALCPNGLCCSKYGYCGNNELYCKLPECQSNCWFDGPGSSDLSDIITRAQFEGMLLNKDNYLCPAKGFYTYDAFITAAKSFPSFGTTGNTAARKKEIAAFFGQTSQETTGRAPDGPYSWGYCYKEQLNPSSTYCEQNTPWPCAPSESYYGRGPMQLLWNYNYGPCGRDIGVDLLNNPNLVANDTVIAFKAAIWFWMTAQPPKPSCHAVITGQWQPSDADLAAGRFPGYGVITNIINGGYECGIDQNQSVKDRINYYEKYCDMLEVSPGENLDCYKQKPFNNAFLDAAF